MEDATPYMPSIVWEELYFKCKQHTIHYPRGPEKYNYLVWCDLTRHQSNNTKIKFVENTHILCIAGAFLIATLSFKTGGRTIKRWRNVNWSFMTLRMSGLFLAFFCKISVSLGIFVCYILQCVFIERSLNTYYSKGKGVWKQMLTLNL